MDELVARIAELKAQRPGIGTWEATQTLILEGYAEELSSTQVYDAVLWAIEGTSLRAEKYLDEHRGSGF